MKFFKPLLSFFILNLQISHELVACDRMPIDMEFRNKNAAGIRLLEEYFGAFYKKYNYVEQHQETVTYDFSHLKKNIEEIRFNVFELNEYCYTFLNRKNRSLEIIKYYIENFEKIHSDVSEPSNILAFKYLGDVLNLMERLPEDSGCPSGDLLEKFMGWVTDNLCSRLNCEPDDLKWNPLTKYNQLPSLQKHWFIFMNDLRSQLFIDDLNNQLESPIIGMNFLQDWVYEGKLEQAYTDFNFSHPKWINIKIVRNIKNNEIILLGSYEYLKGNLSVVML